MRNVSLSINNRTIKVPETDTILDASRKMNIRIPTLCHFSMSNTSMDSHPGSCRVCMVEVKGQERLLPSCSTRVKEGMVVLTHSLRAIRARRQIVELLLSDHPRDCLICHKNGRCELQSLAAELEVRHISYPGERSTYPLDVSSKAIVRDLDKCILCRRCETMCSSVQTVHVLSAVGRGFETVVSPAFGRPMSETACTFCGQCVAVCPTGALTEVNQLPEVWKALEHPEEIVVVQTAPAVRAALGEEFGIAPGTDVTGRMVSALKELGFDLVFDTNFAADVTVMEEAHELIHRLKGGGRLPILTSCCPGWVKFVEHQFGDLLDIPSTCKSPQEMFGAIIKSYYADQMGIDRERIRVVSVMPCLAKKYEAARPELTYEGLPLVDTVITTRELGQMIREAGIAFEKLPDTPFDDPLGTSSGAADLFGASGGVLEAAIRTAADLLTGEDQSSPEFTAIRGIDGIKEATVDVAGRPLRIAVANGLGNARTLLEKIRRGEAAYDAIEIMACPGGCIGGGGQPFIHGDTDILTKRAGTLYAIDGKKELRKAHENPAVLKMYEDYLGPPYGEKAHALLHTSYTWRKRL